MRYHWLVALVMVVGPAVVNAHTAHAEEWSLKKINPFGKKEAPPKPLRPAQEEEGGWLSAVNPLPLLAPITPTGVMDGFTRMGQSTRSVMSRTAATLTPTNLVPDLKIPGFGAAEDPPKPQRRSANQPKSLISPSSWFTSDEDEAEVKNASVIDWLGQPRPK